ncbi:MAG: helix-turn-helix domain-containing protein, partial [Pseudomonadota bacterium]
ISFALPLDDLPRGLGMGVTPLSRSGAGRELAGVLAGLAALAERLPEASAALEGQIRQTLGLAARLAPTRGADDAEVLRAAIAAHIARRHGDPDLSAAPLAAAFGLDPRRLHALFEGTGRSVGARIEAARLAAAARLLEETDLPVSQVARRAGFRDPAYLSRVFRRRHGASPRDWRAARSS